MEQLNEKTIPSFDLEDDKWLEYLTDHGVVVVKNIADADEIQETIKLFWKWI